MTIYASAVPLELVATDIKIHSSHQTLDTGYNIECHNCWACSCHAQDKFLKPCDFSVGIEAYPVGVVEAVKKQSARYAEQIISLELCGDMVSRSMIEKAWVVFGSQLKDSHLFPIAMTSYREAYFKNSVPLLTSVCC